MTRVLVTGSARGVGAEIARQLTEQGHEVVVHGRDATRGEAALSANPGSIGVVTGAFDSIVSTKTCADAVAKFAPYDAIVHNAAVGPDQDAPTGTVDGLERVFHVNVVSPYILSCLLPVTERIVYMGSDAGQQGDAHFDDLQWRDREWNGTQAYADSKLYLAMIAIEMSQRFPTSHINVVHPGWIRTAMGGPKAAKPVEAGADSPVWLATSHDPIASSSGQFVHERRAEPINPQALDPHLRTRLITELERITGLSLPGDVAIG